MAPPLTATTPVPEDRVRVLSVQSHTVQVSNACHEGVNFRKISPAVARSVSGQGGSLSPWRDGIFLVCGTI